MELAFTFCLAGFSMSKHVHVRGNYSVVRSTAWSGAVERERTGLTPDRVLSAPGARFSDLAGPGNGEGVQRRNQGGQGGGLRSQPRQRDQLCGAAPWVKKWMALVILHTDH